MTISFAPDLESKTTSDYQQALHTLNEYFVGDAANDLEDLKLLSTLWHGHRCTCGACEGSWLFTSAQGTLSFWVHGEKVAPHSLQCDSIEATHNAVAA